MMLDPEDPKLTPAEKLIAECIYNTDVGHYPLDSPVVICRFLSSYDEMIDIAALSTLISELMKEMKELHRATLRYPGVDK